MENNSLEIELEKGIAESVLGAKKGGVHNMLAISALEHEKKANQYFGLQESVRFKGAQE